jgi:hypothetical protein
MQWWRHYERLSYNFSGINAVGGTAMVNKDCELCKGSGWYGDNGPGIRGNREYVPCEYCNPKADGDYAVLGDLTREKTDELINDLFTHIKMRGIDMTGMDRSVYQVVVEQWFARHFA